MRKKSNNGKIVILLLFIVGVIGIKGMVCVRASGNEIQMVTETNACLALNYHRVRPKNIGYQLIEWITGTNELTTYTVYQEDFEKQMDELIEAGAYFATPNDLKVFRETGKYPEKCVWISFDDVDESVYKYAFPILKERNIPFTLFIIAGHVGDEDFNNLKMASWEQLREMNESGLATFGSHTYDMHYLEDNQAVFIGKDMHKMFEADIQKSKKVIEEALGVEVTTIAYPFGETTDKITEIVRRSGFLEGYILSPHPITKENDAYYQNRYVVDEEIFEKVVRPWIQ